MLTNMEMYNLITDKGFQIRRNDCIADHSIIEADKDVIRIRLEWQDGKFTCISATQSRTGDINSLPCVGALKNVIAIHKWTCVWGDICKLAKATDILLNTYKELKKL